MTTQTDRTSQPTRADEATIRSLYQQMMEGWNMGNGDAFAAPFTEDGDLVAFDGTHFKGRQSIAQSHQPLFATHLKGTRLVGQITNIRFLASNVALMHAIGGTVLRGKTIPASERASIQTLIATKYGNDWQLAAFQNTRIRPIGQTVAGTFVWLFSDWLWKVLRITR